MSEDDVELRQGAGCTSHKYKARAVANSSVYKEVIFRCEECGWNKRTFKHRNMTEPTAVSYWPSKIQLYDNASEVNDWADLAVVDMQDNGFWGSQ